MTALARQAVLDAFGTAVQQLAEEQAAIAFCIGAGRGDGFDARFARSEAARLEVLISKLRARLETDRQEN